MSSEIAIKVENVSKCYHIYDKPRDRLRQLFAFRETKYYREFWALKDVSFEIPKGETVGIIGRNGSGKSTLLQLICGTLEPTSGNIVANGRIAALLELGAGFNPEFTGRENIYMSCTLLGMKKHETDARFDDIASFADIGNFLDQPVKTYSSGMFVRLAFSVNIMSQPEIMIVDEALAVGDMRFQAKCMTALSRIQNNGATVLFVSHDIGTVKSICTKAIYLDQGEIKAVGKAAHVAELYIQTMREEMNAEHKTIAPMTQADKVEKVISVNHKLTESSKNSVFSFKSSDEFGKSVATFRYGTGDARITFADLVDEEDRSIRHIEFGQKVKIIICFSSQIAADLSCNYYVADEKKNLILGSGMKLAGAEYLKTTIGNKYTVVYKTNFPLSEGNYSIQLQLTRPLVPNQTAEFLDVIDDAIVFSVSRNPAGRIWAQVYLDNQIEVYQE